MMLDTSEEVQSVDGNIIEETITFIRNRYDGKMLNVSLEIGAHILDKFFNNDIELVRSRNLKKKVSYTKLLEHEELGIEATQLSRMIHVAHQEKLFADNKIDLEGLTYSHRVELLAIKDEPTKLQFTKQCLTDKPSIRELRELIKRKNESAPAKSSTGEKASKTNILSALISSAKKMQKTEKMLSSSDIKKSSKKMRAKLHEKAQLLQVHTNKLSSELDNLISTIKKLKEQDQQAEGSKN